MFLITQFVCPLSLQIPQNNYSYKCILYTNINLSSIKFTQVIKLTLYANSSVQFSPVTQSCLTLCDPMDCSMPGLCVHHKL